MKKNLKNHFLTILAILCLIFLFSFPVHAAENKVSVGGEITLSFNATSDYEVDWKIESPSYLQKTGTGRSSIQFGSFIQIVNSATFKGLSVGTTKVSAYNRSTNALISETTVSVVPSINFKLNYNVLILGYNDSFQLRPINVPEGETVTWKSDSYFISVNNDGVVTNRDFWESENGTITCQTSDGVYKATCKVISETPKYTANQQINVGDSTQLTFSFEHHNANDFDIQWQSSNPNSISVDSNGYITAHSPGIVTITGKIGNYALRYTIRSIVKTTPAPQPTKPAVKKISASKFSVQTIKNQTYTKKKVCPSVIVKYSGKVLKKSVDYKITYNNNLQIGKAKCTITGIGKYSGSKSVYFYITPAKQTITYLKSLKSQTASLKFTKPSNLSIVQICYSTNSKFKNAKYSTTTGGSKTIKGLSSKKTYYFKARTYKVVNHKKIYGPYSNIKKIKIK